MNRKRQICPRCDTRYTTYPALSRRDNKTHICNKCGDIEAMNDYVPFKDISLEQLLMEKTFMDKINVSYSNWLKFKVAVETKYSQ